MGKLDNVPAGKQAEPANTLSCRCTHDYTQTSGEEQVHAYLKDEHQNRAKQLDSFANCTIAEGRECSRCHYCGKSFTPEK